MAVDGVYMDVPVVRDFSKKFSQISETLTQVVKVLTALSNVLKATAFIGAVGGAAVAYFIDTVKPYIENVAEKCGEISQDLTASVDAFERGDELGAARFH
ncbi:WXG100 family type VII secretion target [Chloroflexales bacterium ZM16-3]|nr:WXG100 family type VII secretion target [Chloroflexales bacterium ZM16-3]